MNKIVFKNYGMMGLCLAFSLCATAQSELKQGKWHAVLQRLDGHHIPFELDIQKQNGKYNFYILNGAEQIKTKDLVFSKDSAVVIMPVFESYFKVKIIGKDSLSGVWISGSETKDIVMPFTASAGAGRFSGTKIPATVLAGGKWSMEFTRANQTKRKAVGEFSQQGNKLTGSVLTPAADYRYLDGIVTGDSLFFSTFDGSHALLLAAKISHDKMMGDFYAGAAGHEKWIAVKDPNAMLTPAVTAIKDGSDGKLDFSFKDLNGQVVSLKDERFKNKVVILQIMGSWCPNCMDETSFLSEYYLKNKNRGIEVIALAYELSTDDARSRKSMQKFQAQFNIQYPMLNTGVTAGDPQRTEKTLPQLTAVKSFPTTIILDKDKVVADIETAFYGPGTGEYYLKYKTHFEATVDALLDKK